MRQVGFNVSSDIYDKVEKLCEKTGTTKTRQLNILLRSALRNQDIQPEDFTDRLKQIKSDLEIIHKEFEAHTINGDWLGDYSGPTVDAVSDLIYWSEKLDESGEPL